MKSDQSMCNLNKGEGAKEVVFYKGGGGHFLENYLAFYESCVLKSDL